jgi:hypothetical protein
VDALDEGDDGDEEDVVDASEFVVVGLDIKVEDGPNFVIELGDEDELAVPLLFDQVTALLPT